MLIPKYHLHLFFDDKFINGLKKEKSSKARAEELKSAIVEHIERHYEEDPEFYERFSDILKKILEVYKDNWDVLTIELERIREAIKQGRESENTFGFDSKSEMPFFGLLKQEIYGKKSIEMLGDKDVEYLIDLTKDVIETIGREVQVVDFWESFSKQKNLKSYIISHLLKSYPSPKKDNTAKEPPAPHQVSSNEVLFGRRNEIAQKLMEIAYHIYGK